MVFTARRPSRKWLRSIFLDLTGEIPVALQNRKRAWFTDTLEDVNGVATTIHKMTAAGAAAGKELTVVTSSGNLQTGDIPIKNFPPIGEFELPEYELQKLSFPPVLQMLDYIQREKFTEIIISTPGPGRAHRIACSQNAQSADERNLSHRFPAIRPDSYRGQLPGKRRVALHALVLWTARHRFR